MFTARLVTMRNYALRFTFYAVLSLLAAACAGPVDTSKAYSRGVINSGGIVPADELRVAEYLNYYKQSFPEPVDTTVGLDLRLGNPQVPAAGGEAWLQIGLQARSARQDRDAKGTETVAPLNLALVIDRSGSMSAADKMPYLKQSLRAFLQSLQPADIVAIVGYDDVPELVLPAQPAGPTTNSGGRRWLEAAINRLEPRGSTNLHDGLMLGFQEVDRNFDVRRNNRVILLTDGIANVGITDADRIAADARAYNDKGIYLSTIGLGRDFNDALLVRLATQGKGAYHFIDSAAEMDKVFRQEVSGLLQKAAGDVSVVLQPGQGVRLLDLTGYEGRPPAGPLEVRLRDMGTGDSQVLMAHISVDPASCPARAACRLAAVEMRYTDLFAQRPASLKLTALADGWDGRSGSDGSGGGYDPLQDVEVLRNVTIQRTAQGLKEIANLYAGRSYQAAWELACRQEQDLRRVAALTHEEQMYQDADMLRRYQATLAQWVERETGRQPSAPAKEPPDGERQPNHRAPLPAIEVQ